MREQHFDFDTPIDRRNTASMKWEKYGNPDVIPMWVADMDFACAPAILKALHRRVDHGIFGYTQPPQDLVHETVAYLEREYSWQIDPDWIVWLPGLVVGLNVVARAFGEPGDDVITATPIYPPFLTAPVNGARNVVRVPMLHEGGRWTWDIERLDSSITSRSRLLLLCNPHNPVGRVFERQELLEIAAVCQRHDLALVSDEIHAGLILDRDKRHVPIASLDHEVAQRTVTLMSASKTFNLPSLGCAYAIASSPVLRDRLKKVMAGIVHHVGLMGYIATLAAYRDGKFWQLALLDYLRGNRDRVEQAVGANSLLKITHAEATYLSWIDACALPISDVAKFLEDAGVGVYDGALFGAPGFVRLNFACPRSVLDRALDRMMGAIDRLN
jgi:cysteine-S-conjugate beta-lyase